MFDQGRPRPSGVVGYWPALMGRAPVRVEVSVGDTTWLTSVFPDKASGCFVLPVKRQVRTAEGLDAGEEVAVSLRVVASDGA